MKYKGIRKARNRGGRIVYRVRFSYNGKNYEFGEYNNEKDCARAYDLFILKNNIKRDTNFLKPLKHE